MFFVEDGSGPLKSILSRSMGFVALMSVPGFGVLVEHIHGMIHMFFLHHRLSRGDFGFVRSAACKLFRGDIIDYVCPQD